MSREIIERSRTFPTHINFSYWKQHAGFSNEYASLFHKMMSVKDEGKIFDCLVFVFSFEDITYI